MTKAKNAAAKSAAAGRATWPTPNAHGVYSEKNADTFTFDARDLRVVIRVLQIGPALFAAGYECRIGGAQGGGGPITKREAKATATDAFAHEALGRAESVLAVAKGKSGGAAESLRARLAVDLGHYLAWCRRFLPAIGGHIERLDAIAKKLGPVKLTARTPNKATAPRPLEPAKPLDLDAIKAPGEPRHVPLGKVRLSPLQPRKIYPDDEEQRGFEASIAANGVQQSLLMRPHPAERGAFEIVAGERRYKAALKAKLATVPAIVKPLGDREALAAAALENVQRADMHPLDEGRAFKLLRDLGTSTEAIADMQGKTQRFVQKRIALAEKLPEAAHKALAAGKLLLSQADVLASIDDAGVRDRMLEKAIGHAWYTDEAMRGDLASISYRKKQAEERKKNPPKARPERRVHERKIKYPEPDAGGVYKWPKGHSETGHVWETFAGEVLTIRTCRLAIEKGANEYAHKHIHGFAYAIKGGPEYAERLTREHGLHNFGDDMACERRAAEHLIEKALPLPNAATTRALIRDVAGFIHNRLLRGKAGKELAEKLDAKFVALFPPGPPQTPVNHAAPASGKGKLRAADARRAAEPHAAPAGQAGPEFAGKLEVPAAPNFSGAPRTYDETPKAAGETLSPIEKAGGVALVAGGRWQHSPNRAAIAADVPDEIVVERAGRFFAYTFSGEFDSEARRASEAAYDKPRPAKRAKTAKAETPPVDPALPAPAPAPAAAEPAKAAA